MIGNPALSPMVAVSTNQSTDPMALLSGERSSSSTASHLERVLKA